MASRENEEKGSQRSQMGAKEIPNGCQKDTKTDANVYEKGAKMEPKSIPKVIEKQCQN